MATVCSGCGRTSVMKVPHGRIISDPSGVTIATEHSYQCLNKDCGYKSERIRVNTEQGDIMELPWYKRIFK
jgi:hypothetical protein